VQLSLSGRAGVLHCDARAEVNVFTYSGSEVRIGRQGGVVHSSDIQIDKPLPLGLRDVQATMHVNQVPKAKLSGEHVRPAKGLSRERCQVLDMLRSTGPEQWPKDRVAQHAAVERVLKAMNGLNPASELQQGWHRDTSQLMM